MSSALEALSGGLDGELPAGGDDVLVVSADASSSSSSSSSV